MAEVYAKHCGSLTSLVGKGKVTDHMVGVEHRDGVVVVDCPYFNASQCEVGIDSSVRALHKAREELGDGGAAAAVRLYYLSKLAYHSARSLPIISSPSCKFVQE
tara:strand:- start:943 stop:1254 length:312 start_codon:yes stop_codon:yes gene_type:complete